MAIMKVREPRKLIISVLSFIAMWAFFMWMVASGPHP